MSTNPDACRARERLRPMLAISTDLLYNKDKGFNQVGAVLRSADNLLACE